jgi:RNA-directed DNA polymerase
MPKESDRYPRPSQILSRENLLATWKYSRDSSSQAGARGSDGVTAHRFAANLDENLRRIAGEIRLGQYYFSRLRPLPVIKPGSAKKRIVCIPTIRDRLVQRRIAFYLDNKKLLPIYNPISFGFVPDQGVKKAISKTIEYREVYDYVFETDIVGFFDNIPRAKLLENIKFALGRHSLVPLISQVIGAEVSSTKDCSEKDLAELGIRKGVGIRQGMPLSPILSNLALSEFDLTMRRHGIPMVRYADDIVTFGRSKEEANEYYVIVRDELARHGFSIPDLGRGSKSKIAGKFEPITFLGREIAFSDREGRFIQRVSNSKIESIVESMRTGLSLHYLLKADVNFLDASKKLSQTVASYVSSYSDAHNAVHVENELRAAAKKIIKSIYTEIFGSDRVGASGKYARFLGFDTIDLEAAEIIDLY